ncbi:WIAG-tail domain, partial [Mesorhizobium sp. M00.F.Ca.ET.186.01.1.1]
VSLKYTKRTSAVLTVFRQETGQEDSGVLQWIAIGEKGEQVHDEVAALHHEQQEDDDLGEEWEEGEYEADEDSGEEKASDEHGTFRDEDDLHS